jgi:hypothetical protein
MSKNRKVSRKTAVRRADYWFARYIKLRDGYRSVLSGEGEEHGHTMHCGHLITRRRYATRWDEANAFCQTAGENFLHEHDPYPFFRWYIERFGKDALDALDTKSRQTTKYTTNEILDIADAFKKKCSYIENGDTMFHSTLQTTRGRHGSG